MENLQDELTYVFHVLDEEMESWIGQIIYLR